MTSVPGAQESAAAVPCNEGVVAWISSALRPSHNCVANTYVTDGWKQRRTAVVDMGPNRKPILHLHLLSMSGILWEVVHVWCKQRVTRLFKFAVHAGIHGAVNSSFRGCYSCLHERQCAFLLQNAARLCVQLLFMGLPGGY
jgi:hypothetical protein